jgi:ribonuclease E
LRDLGGLVVIDFIDMMNSRNQRAVENRLNAAVQADRARVQIGRISRFGLLEMSRQRLKPSLGESTQIVCPRCTGQGTIRTVESLSLSLVRILEEEALKAGTARVDIQVPVDVATYILNEKRQAILDIEKLSGVHVLIVANPTLETPQYKVERIRKSEHDETDETASYQRVEKETKYSVDVTPEKLIQPEKAAVSSISPGRRPTVSPPVVVDKAKPKGLLNKIVSIFSGDKEEKPEVKKADSRANKAADSSRNRNPRSAQNRSRSNRGRSRSRPRKPDTNLSSEQSSKQGSRKGDRKGTAKTSAGTQSKSAVDKTKESAAKRQDTTQSDSQPGSKSASQSNRNRRRRSSGSRSKNTEVSISSENVSASSAPANETKSTAASKPASQPGKADSSANQEQRSNLPRNIETSAGTDTEKDKGQEQKASAPSNVDKAGVDKPQVDKPVADLANSPKPKTDNPEAQEPKAQEPKAQEPKAQEPKAQEPKAQEPKADKPRSDKPRSDKPKANKPRADKPKADKPKKVNKPKLDKPETEKPAADKQPTSNENRAANSAIDD